MDNYASIESQLGEAVCEIEDTEEMFWLKESDDYDSLVSYGNKLAQQYRFKEAIDAYRKAELIKSTDPMLYVRMGGSYLTLFLFDDAIVCYEKSLALGLNIKNVAYSIGVYHYLQRDYVKASEFFSKVLPSNDEMTIAVIYWNALSCLRAGIPDSLLQTFNKDMKVGHHKSYETAVKVMLSELSLDDAISIIESNSNDLDYVVSIYGIAAYCESIDEREKSVSLYNKLLTKKSVWPCVSYLAAYNDVNNTANI